MINHQSLDRAAIGARLEDKSVSIVPEGCTTDLDQQNRVLAGGESVRATPGLAVAIDNDGTDN